MPTVPPAEAVPESGPALILQGGTDELQLDPGGKVYRPGDTMPASLSYARRLQLQAAGIRFETRHTDPAPAPKGKKDEPKEDDEA